MKIFIITLINIIKIIVLKFYTFIINENFY